MDFDEDDCNFNEDDCWDEPELRSSFDKRSNRGGGSTRNRRYNDAYGEYRGGYPPGPFGPGPSGPPPLMGPPRMGMFPRGPPPPFSMGPVIYGRGYGGGPPRMGKDSPAIRYLMRCGIPRNNLKNLPPQMLDLIEPEHCGLCGHNFDSFTLSRVHYISKNHAKAQKKWLAQNNTMSAHSPQEAPLRSRELYCELCDVEITSKVHAESHYKGKAHHAVVDGRKNPKNPALLQYGMERRLDQLIRRELKFLKKAAEATEEEEDKKDIKPIQPELYCDICKTHVTCTDQMTAHLNGKRHLAKEKHYILSSMRGDVKDIAVKQEPEDGGENGDGENGDGENGKNAAEAAQGKEEDWQDNWE